MDISEGLKKILLAGVGAVAVTGEAAKNVIDTLVEKGEISVEQGKALNEEFKAAARDKFNKHVYTAVDKMSKEELNVLKQKVEEAAARREAAAEEASAQECKEEGCSESDCSCGEGCDAPEGECKASEECCCEENKAE